jgi:hypothetical protein
MKTRSACTQPNTDPPAVANKDTIEGSIETVPFQSELQKGESMEDLLSKLPEVHHSRYDRQKAQENAHPPPSHLHVQLNEDTIKRWILGYQEDVTLKQRWTEANRDNQSWHPGKCYYRSQDGLLYFRNTDFIPRLCVPKSMQNVVLSEAHDSPTETAHGGLEKVWLHLKEQFFWPHMQKDIQAFCDSCNVCQKTKPVNFKRYGYLHPNSIPLVPYESVSLDLIGPLPMSGESFTAILVVVNRLSKHSQFIPTMFELKTEGFGYLFVQHVVCRYGLPRIIYAD